ncbi:ATP-dependent protease La Type I [Citrifermentans bremense]|uniref:Lon protease n=1 Tax=Citrifermentans bremense TaxID=60035 RepID=A0A6S6M161_9BACT|nr:endopeptidase La [Citrifermentans bremense]BCG48102.1 ATP-dependent protease La Type I [Citrifermentans bremense]
MTEKARTRGKKRGNPERFPLFPLRDIVIFPHMVIPLFVGREKSVLALEAAMAQNDKLILLATQKNAKTEDPEPGDIYTVGTLCQVIQLLKLPDGTVKVLVEGKRRGSIASFSDNSEYFEVEVEVLEEQSGNDSENEALKRGVLASFESYAELNSSVPSELLQTVQAIADPSRLADSIAPHLNLKVAQKQELLAAVQPARRMERLLSLMGAEIEILQIEKKIHARVKKQMEKTQKDYYLNEQIRAIQKELGGKDEFKQELRTLEAKAAKLPLSPEAKQKIQSEIKKLKFMSPMSAEASVVRNYVEWLLALPWGAYAEENRELKVARERLDADHYGLEKVKLRILEFLAVNALAPGMKGPILCLVGPPGVGKTSLARSVAKATGRDFVKISLGGVRDEAEIRGHRRTYVGAMPGRIIQSLKKCGSSNPVFLLDEIDKMSSDFRGDPASALLEVLDPEQNHCFNDHFLDLDYDLSQVMFITTANSSHTIPRPLLDRMEVVRLDGYTEHEKLAIAREYLVPKQAAANGLAGKGVGFTDSAVLELVRRYTREAGVRNLEREIGSICRKIAFAVAGGGKLRRTVQPRQIAGYLGAPRFKYGEAGLEDAVGLVTGLAWTEVGGELLNIEVVSLPGKGKLTVTGKLGEVMQESAQAAMTYVRSRGELLGFAKDFYQHLDIHIHVPEGAIPKDGPSAGIAMACALTSALTRRPVRRDIAMTGEVTLRGTVLPIGGLKEKLLAAGRGGIRTVLIPKENEKDLAEIPKEIRAGITVHPVAHMDEVLGYALLAPVGLAPAALYGDATVAVAENSVVPH